MTDQQLTREDIRGMTPEQIVEALDAGRFEVMLGNSPEQAALIDRAQTATITASDVAELARIGRHDLIAAAQDAGRVDLTTTTAQEG